MKRESFKSRLGFILVSAGCAIGIGNVWRFPYVVGENGTLTACTSHGCYMLMMYYTTVSGWMVTYFYKFLIGEFQAGMDAEAAGAVFSNLLADPLQMSFWMILTVILGFFVCSRGLQNGLEKISKVMMSALLGLIVILAVQILAPSPARLLSRPI